MTTLTPLTTVPAPTRAAGTIRTFPALATLAYLAVVCAITLSPPAGVGALRWRLTRWLHGVTAPFGVTPSGDQIEAWANVAMFVPLGVLLALSVRRAGTLVALVGGLAVSVLVELIQFQLPGRVPDAGDVLANTLGAVVGGVAVAIGTGLGIGALVLLLGLLLAGGVWLVSSPVRLPGAGAFPSTIAATGAQDGLVGDEPLSPYDDASPAIANLEPGLRVAVQDAARAAADDGVELVVTSGWRSARYQQSLLDAAVARYGSREEAARFVLPPERSRHVTGQAVDIGRTDASSWLQQHGADYGLCQTYANERWHFELAVEPGGACPPPLRDASGVAPAHELD